MPFSLFSGPAAVVRAGLIVLALSAQGTSATAQEATAPSRVRSESPWIGAAIFQGKERSPTQLSIGIAGRYRFLRILVASRKAPGCELTAAIGHELQHALEVLSEPKVRTTLDMFAFFDQNAPAGWRDSFETEEAVRVGLLVDKEACR